MGDEGGQPSTVAAATVTPGPAPTLARALRPGDVIWIDMPDAHTQGSEQQKRRPWVVVSTEHFNQGHLGLFIAVPLSSKATMADIKKPGRIKIDSGTVTYRDKGAPKPLERIDRCALTDQVRTLSEKRIIGHVVASVSSRVLDNVRSGIAFHLDL